MKEFWDQRYQSEAFAYGENANDFLAEQLQKIIPGTILFPAEGEGRNAVYAATKSWQVTAFDISLQGQKKALQLAQKNKVEIKYLVGDLENDINLAFTPESFDAIAFIYAHFPAKLKHNYHAILNQFLKKGGVVIFEAFSKNHLDYQVKNDKIGGPKELDMLYSIEEIKAYFSNFEILLLEEKEVELHEGLFHNGIGSVIRFVGIKQ